MLLLLISIVQGGFQCKLNNGACTIISHRTVKMKHIWQVYLTSELKIKLFFLVTVHAMVWKQIFNFFGFTKICNDSKWAKASRNEVMQPTTSKNNSQPIFPYMSTIRQVLTMPLWTEEALFTWQLRRRVSLFKYLQEFKVVYQ